MNSGVEFEVVLCLEGLLTDRAFEPSPDAVSREVAPEVPLTGEHLLAVGTGKAV